MWRDATSPRPNPTNPWPLCCVPIPPPSARHLGTSPSPHSAPLPRTQKPVHAHPPDATHVDVRCITFQLKKRARGGWQGQGRDCRGRGAEQPGDECGRGASGGAPVSRQRSQPSPLRYGIFQRFLLMRLIVPVTTRKVLAIIDANHLAAPPESAGGRHRFHKPGRCCPQRGQTGRRCNLPRCAPAAMLSHLRDGLDAAQLDTLPTMRRVKLVKQQRPKAVLMQMPRLSADIEWISLVIYVCNHWNR